MERLKQLRGILALLVLIAFGSMVAVPAADAVPTVGAGAIIQTDSVQVDSRLQTLTLTSTALPAPTHVNVLLPDGYDPKARAGYPVLYLLHGGLGSYRDWISAGNAEALTAGLKLIVVMPDNGPGGWYTDWFAPGTDGAMPAWETYHVEQLVPWIDSEFNTEGDRAGRAIAGLSMGGFGAFSYAARHPDLFAAAASWSGAVNTNDPPSEAAHFIDGIGGLSGGKPGSLFGPRETQEINWRGHNPWDLADNLRDMNLSIRTGNGQPGGPLGGTGVDAIESLVHPMNVDMDAELTRLGIRHLFDDYGPGAHAWAYWQRDLAEDLPRFMATFRKHVKPPVPFAYRSVEPDYSVYGWKVSVKRKVEEFSRLSKARPAGFVLNGSGKASVTTPGIYRKGAKYRIRSNGRNQTKRPDARGRLHLTVNLGPSNTVQANSVPEVNQPQPSVTRTVGIRRLPAKKRHPNGG